MRKSFPTCIRALVLLASVFPSPAAAKQDPANSTAAKISTIRVIGQKIFTAEQIIAATGLKVGQTFDQKNLDAVAERLGKSGAFPTIGYSYTPDAGLISIEFKVEEAAKFRECVFDDFVWLTDGEIQARLRKDVPLYVGVAPETGEMLDEIARSLEELSEEKGVKVHVVRRVRQENIIETGGDPDWKHLYAAEGPQIKIQSFRFTGALAVKPSDLQREAEQSVGRDYSMFQCVVLGTAAILPYYREHGFLRVSLGPPTTQILSKSSDSSEFVVEVVYAVKEGNPYSWTATEWTGNQAMTGATLDQFTGMKPNDVANGKKIDEGWDAVRKAYSKDGYFEAVVASEAVFDESSHLVHYRVAVTEGPQYRMGELLVCGVPPTAADRLKKRWHLKRGDVFDMTYVADFMKKDGLAALQGALKPGSRVRITTNKDREKHTVNVVINAE